MQEVVLEPLWVEIISVYEAFRRICEKHKFRFWASFGTALGAVRHKGFIPWDDDFDVMMPDQDYDAFMKIAPEELPEHLRIINIDNTREFFFSFGKIQDIRWDVSDRIARETGHPQNEGIYIDVFPFHGVPSQTIFRKICDAALRCRQSAILRSCSSCATDRAKVANLLGKMLGFAMPELRTAREIADFQFRRGRQLSFDESEFVGTYNIPHCCNYNIYRREWFDQTVWLPFENTQVPMPCAYNECLTAAFGDYMTLPPKEKRCFTHVSCPPAAWKFGPTGEWK